MEEHDMKIGIFLETNNNHILPVGLELIGKTIAMMGKSPYTMHGIVVKSKEDDLTADNFDDIKIYLDQVFIFEYEDKYLTTEHYKEALCAYAENEHPEILLLGATPLGRSFGPRVAAYFKTGITADCTGLQVEDDGLVQVRPAFGEEILAEIVTPNSFPQMATVRPGVMDPPTAKGTKNPPIRITRRTLPDKKLTIINRCVNRQEIELGKADMVVIAGNAIRDEEDLALVKALAQALGAEYGVTRPVVEGGLAPHARQVGVSGTILSASIVLLLGVSGSNKTLAGIRKAKKLIAINNDPHATIFDKVDIGIVDDWKEFTMNLLHKKETIDNEEN